MTETRKAQCACGAVALQIMGDPAVMAYCHCDSCRSWLGAPIHAAALWPTTNVTITAGEDRLGIYSRTDQSHRHFCKDCGAPVLIRHPVIRMTDVPAGNVQGLAYQATMHVNYAETVLPIKDGLPKYAGMPAADGSGDLISE